MSRPLEQCRKSKVLHGGIPMKPDHADASLSTRIEVSSLPIVLGFAEESARAFGLSPADALKVRLATEEVFTYILEAGGAGRKIVIEATNGVYYAQLKLRFEAAHFDPRAFNLTTSVSPDDSGGLEDMGLLIASRSVERFQIVHDIREGISLVLIKEKSYPEAMAAGTPEPPQMERFHVKVPEPEILKMVVSQVATFYPQDLYPVDFRFPGKIVDMTASGEYGALTANDDRGAIGGGILWARPPGKLIEVFGPYLFNQPAAYGMAAKLLDAFLGHIAKTEALFVINRYATPEIPVGYFELLGTIDQVLDDGTRKSWPYFYRQLKEDPGSQVWVQQNLESFLRKEYSRLFLPRDIMLTQYAGENRPAHSVFGVRFFRPQNTVTLNPVWDGRDAGDNLTRHIEALKADSIANILFELDCAYPWQANLSPVLIEKGFSPRLVLPYGGQGDLVIFQYIGEVR
jgi:anti-sigma regulatory factor (Ser/Thr protein kinase)